MSSRPTPSPEFFALQPIVAGRYSLDRELGRGGMGVVFLAHDVALDRPVAIKLLPPQLAQSGSLRHRFLREARAAARLSHPHIVPVHAVEEHASLAFFVMAFVDGETLGERVRRSGPLGPAEATRVMQEVAWALAHAHAHGIAHRDVKPDNVMLERATGRAVVTDFGIARHVDGDTPPGEALGTPQYMSPEQACGEPGDARSDLYALGATLFYALTGRPPFQAPTAVALLAQHATATPPTVAQVRAGVPARLAALVDRCLAKEPAARPASADALAESLRAAQGPELPGPLRSYLREAEGSLYDAGTALAASGVSLALWPMHDDGVFASIFATLVFLSTAGITASLGLARLAQLAGATRALVRAGYGRDAVRAGLAHLDRERADESAERPRGERGWRSARTWGRLAAGAAATAASAWLSLAGDGGAELIGAFGSIVFPTVTLRALWGDVRRGPPLWARVLRGGIGRALFGLASRGLPRPAPAPVAGQPTAMRLEHAAEDLYAALPPGERAAIGDVPALLRRLREEAAAEAHRPAAVAALEALRLDLMRLHAGLAKPGDLTRHIDDARRIGDRIDARLSLEES